MGVTVTPLYTMWALDSTDEWVDYHFCDPSRQRLLDLCNWVIGVLEGKRDAEVTWSVIPCAHEICRTAFDSFFIAFASHIGADGLALNEAIDLNRRARHSQPELDALGIRGYACKLTELMGARLDGVLGLSRPRGRPPKATQPVKPRRSPTSRVARGALPAARRIRPRCGSPAP